MTDKSAAPERLDTPATDDRDALVEVVAKARFDWDGLSVAVDVPPEDEYIADALLARGLRLPPQPETLAWAVVVDGDIVWVDVGHKRDVAEHVAEGEGGSVVRAAIRVVDDEADASRP